MRLLVLKHHIGLYMVVLLLPMRKVKSFDRSDYTQPSIDRVLDKIAAYVEAKRVMR